MKIAQVAPLIESVPPRLYCGTERVVSYLTEELVRQGHDVTLFASGDSQTAGFDEAFWDDQLGMYALALDSKKRPCRVRSSNAGQVLLTGIALPERAARMARVLLDREFFTGWGLRTLSTRERRFNPASYHNGSIWPHDNALIAMGLASYGHCTEAVQIANAVLDAAAHMD